MTASFSTTARPPTAAIAWATKDAIFCEIPSKDGPPFIIRERKTIEGLSRVLNVLIEHDEPVHRSVPQSHPSIKPIPASITAKTRAPWASDADRERVQGILKRLKIT